MATIAEINLPADEFALSHTLDTLSDVEFEVERIVAHDPDSIMPYIWVTSANPTELEQVLANDTSIDAIKNLAQPEDGQVLYQMEWIASIETLVHILVEEEGTILAAEGRQDGWNMRILVPDREALSRTYEFCEENDLSLELQRVYDVSQGKEGRFGLTEAQATVITTAYDNGFYNVPRGISLTDLADIIEISHQALSERLRRGHQTLVENSVVVGQGGDDDAQ
jgi:predicted DNA binding protein